MITRTPQSPRQQSLTWVKLGIALVGIATWGYGQRVENVRVEWFGIALVVVAFVLRWVGRRE